MEYERSTAPLVVHTTERADFKRCRTLWDYRSPNMLNLEPITPQVHFEFGTAFHHALAFYYDPSTPRTLEVAQEAWKQITNEQQRFYDRNFGGLIDNDEAREEFDQRVTLGYGMLDYYVTVFSAENDAHLTCVWVERPYVVRVKYRSRELYGFKPDALFRDDDGRYWLGEWKTAENTYEFEEWLALDDQTGSYILKIQQAEDIEIEGVLHTTAAKRVAEPLKINKDGSPSRDKRQITTFDIAIAQLREHFGVGNVPEIYTDLLTKLQSEGGDKFVKRVLSRRNAAEIEGIQRMIEIETAEMRRLRLHPELITRSPSRFNCAGCSFLVPCIERANGNYEGEQEMLDNLYRVKE